MKGSDIFAITYKGVGRLRVSADTVSDVISSNNEPTKNQAEYGRLSAPLLKGRVTKRPFWLISKHENGQTEVFTIHPGSSRETLPIFSHEEEAEIFLWLGSPGAGWRAREITVGELVSLLCGTYADVVEVALDPLPLFGDEAMAGLVSLFREDFVQNLIDERGLRAPYWGSFEPEVRVDSRLSEGFRRRRV